MPLKISSLPETVRYTEHTGQDGGSGIQCPAVVGLGDRINAGDLLAESHHLPNGLVVGGIGGQVHDQCPCAAVDVKVGKDVGVGQEKFHNCPGFDMPSGIVTAPIVSCQWVANCRFISSPRMGLIEPLPL